jgi:hypothetical protein
MRLPMTPAEYVDQIALPTLKEFRDNKHSRRSRVEERRGNADLKPAPRFLSPLIEPDVRVCRIRLCDWLRVRLTAATPTLGAGDGGRRVRRTLACRRTPACRAPAACAAV